MSKFIRHTRSSARSDSDADSPPPSSHSASLLVNSNISRDTTKGRSAIEDESLADLKPGQEGKALRRSLTYLTRRVSPKRIYSESEESDAPEDPAQPIAEPLWRAAALRRRSERDGGQKSGHNSTNDQIVEMEKMILSERTESDSGGHEKRPLKLKGKLKSANRQKKDRVLQEDTDSDASPPLGSATYLARQASIKLGLDLYDNSDLAKFFGSLLDVIERQRYHIDFLNMKNQEVTNGQNRPQRSRTQDTRKPTTPKTQNDASDSSAQADEEMPRYQVLHRVQCGRRNHRHATGLFLDRPSRRGVELNGNLIVWDLTKHLFENSTLLFIVFLEYDCEGIPSSRRKHDQFRKKQTKNDEIHEIVPDDESILVVSGTLRSALFEIGICSPFDGKNYSEMKTPYLFVYHHRAQLRNIAKDETQEDHALHVSALLSYIESQNKTEFDDADAKFEKGVVIPEHLPKLFIPNEMLVTYRKDHVHACIIDKWPDRRNFDRGEADEFKINCWSWSYNGRHLARDRRSEKVTLSHHEEVPIVELRVFPLRYASEKLKSRLRIRGQKFWNSRFQHLVAYTGLDFNTEATYDKTRFMIDTLTYHKMHKSAPDTLLEKDRFDHWPEEIPREKAQLPDAELMLLPPNIYGFDFLEKEWVNLCVDLIEDVKWNKGAFNQLVLHSKTKELIQALVTARTSGMKDIIANKGNGLAILLHGGPGTGKTLTAETVAEISEKPLFRVTCGDLGADATEVEKHLTSIFNLGKIWGCVLLLDEADIFLEERSFADLHRNRIVSVFLKSIEYYDGILLLTSNRVGTFDAAFKSRIQVSLHYSNLSRASRKKIWRNFIDILESLDEEVDVAELERRLDDLAEEEMNGRQIRNCVTTARGLAAFRNQKLGWQHLEQAIRTASEFQKYLRDVHEGLTEDEMAREDNLR